MKLLKITSKNSIYFRMSDGRLGIVYASGYVRVSTKSPNFYSKNVRMYQINKKLTTQYGKLNDQYHYKRVLLNSSEDRIKMLFEFNQKNCI